MKLHAPAALIAAALLASCASTQSVLPEPASASTSTSTTVRHAASLVTEIDDLQAVADYARSAPPRTLFVFDIDDTLLTAEQFFGSDYWYEWQKAKDLPSDRTVKCKFDYIALNYEAQTMKPTQLDAPAIFNAVTQPKLYLTSRGGNYRGGTERELKRNGYEFPRALNGNPEGQLWDWSSADNTRHATLSYFRGVFMTSGQDKGVVLLHLLERMGQRNAYDHVVLVDDGQANQDNMRKALADAGIGFRGFHYTRISKPQPINAELAKQAEDDYDASRKYLKDVFPSRYEELQRGDCAY